MKNITVFISLLYICNIFSQTNDEISLHFSKKWHHLDYQENKVLGTSLNKWYAQNNSIPKRKKVIVAVLDTQMDLKHEDLQLSLWTNGKEIPNNGIDDDKNGFVDDIHGWTFLGTKNGHYMVYENYEYVRYLRTFKSLFENKKKEEISKKDLGNFIEYQRALEFYNDKIKFYKNWHKSVVFKSNVFKVAKDTLKYFFPKEDYTIKQLDSMYQIYKVNDKTFKQRRDSNDRDLGALISYLKSSYELNQFTFEDVQQRKAQLDSVLEKNINIDFNERKEIGDNPNYFEKVYGNNKIGAIIKDVQEINEHATGVASIIAANRKNNIGITGFSDDILIMPIHISASGDEHDKDIAAAIYYAVDNGAKVINMSFGKEFSLYPHWVKEAFLYAQKHNVLLVHAVGNESINIDKTPFYPNDYDYSTKTETANNFINVGSVNKDFGEKMVSDFSNYGKENVDIFAPGNEIYLATPDNKYDFNSGTSLACPMVSGTAALLWLYYPKLTVQQVKKIILDSSVKITFPVQVPGEKEGTLKPLSELCKSGGILNVYNAMEMAGKMNKKN